MLGTLVIEETGTSPAKDRKFGDRGDREPGGAGDRGDKGLGGDYDRGHQARHGVPATTATLFTLYRVGEYLATGGRGDDIMYTALNNVWVAQGLKLFFFLLKISVVLAGLTPR